MQAFHDVGLTLIAALLSWALVGLYMLTMRAADRLEPPNERSMHKVPVPVGAGLGIVAATALLWPLFHGHGLSTLQQVLLACFAGLGALSWVDDRLTLSPAVRLGAQGVAVAACLCLLPVDVRLVHVLPLLAERLLLGLAWVWYINLFNFMDGIDGLAGSQAVAMAIGYLALAWFVGMDGPYGRLALIVTASSAGYLVWNWHPAKVLMGDAGSIPLGFVLGWLMIDLATAGYWPAAIILPLYFVADATLTLLKRVARGERPWKAHREHYYQHAVLAGLSPSHVVARISAANVVLGLLALFSARHPALALSGAAAVVAALLVHLHAVGAAPGTTTAP
jgi:UDP-N-acetylmuramyl pentapeptide phosphotransferase/UDP-N-acetylglucosamine-1-phosphate transferase